jgi:hypothetical protein
MKLGRVPSSSVSAIGLDPWDAAADVTAMHRPYRIPR